MIGKKGQVSTEYMVVTGFILAVVTVIFAYSYVSNSETIKVNQASNALDRMVNKADLVYALGPDNNHFVFVTFPEGVQMIQDVTICANGDNVHYGEGESSCQGPGQGYVTAGAIEMQLSHLAGVSKISRPARAEIELDVKNAVDLTDIFNPPNSSGATRIRLKVYWCGEKICIARA